MKWLLFLILISLPAYQIRFKIFNLPTTLLEAMILILFLIWLAKKIYTHKPLIYNLKEWLWLILAWLLVGLLAVFISPNKWLALGHWRAYFLEPILFLLIFLDLIKTEEDLNFVFYTFGISALYISFWAIWQKITGQGMKSLEIWQYPLKAIIRSTGPFPHSNFLGLYLGPIIILAIGKLIENFKLKIEKLNKFLGISYWLLVIIASVIAIIFARSEGAILGTTTGLIFFFLISLKKKQRLIFILVLLFIISYLLFISPQRNYFWQKITFQDLSIQMRLNIWQAAIELIKDRPIFGAGLRGYQKLIFQYQKSFSLPTGEIISYEIHPYPHNLFLAIWSELGILGLVVFSFVIYQFFKFGFQKLFRNLRLEIRNSELAKNEKILIIAILSAMVTILIHGLVDTPYFKNDLSILFWLIIGLMIVIKKIAKINKFLYNKEKVKI